MDSSNQAASSQRRIKAETLARLAALAEHYGLETSSTLAFVVNQAHREIFAQSGRAQRAERPKSELQLAKEAAAMRKLAADQAKADKVEADAARAEALLGYKARYLSKYGWTLATNDSWTPDAQPTNDLKWAAADARNTMWADFKHEYDGEPYVEPDLSDHHALHHQPDGSILNGKGKNVLAGYAEGLDEAKAALAEAGE